MAVRAVSMAAMVAITVAVSDRAHSYDIDCKLILCLAGGFPAGCADAWRHFIDRITAFPPKSPIGLCLQHDGTPYRNYELHYALFGRHDPRGYACPDETNLHVRGRANHGEAFCYTHRTAIGTGQPHRHRPLFEDGPVIATREGDLGPEFHERDTSTHYIYSGNTKPVRIRLETEMTVEPRSREAYSSGRRRWAPDGTPVLVAD